MALDAADRSSIYTRLVPLLGNDANALMSEFPSVEADELVTKDFLRAELEATKSELRAEFRSGADELRSDFDELRAEFGDLRAEFGDLRAGMSSLETRLTIRIGASWAAGVAALAALQQFG